MKLVASTLATLGVQDAALFALANLARRPQLAVVQRSVKRPRLSNVDRSIWVLLRRFWTDWDRVLVIIKPDTVVRWHRAVFRRYWTWKRVAAAGPVDHASFRKSRN